MSDVQAQINVLVHSFVQSVTELARQAAMDMLGSALGGRAGAVVVRRGPGRPPGGGAGAHYAAANGARRKGAKRTSADLEKLSERVVHFITKNPGLRIEQINKQLGTTTKDLALPIRKLVSDGVLGTKGEKRATVYHAKK